MLSRSGTKMLSVNTVVKILDSINSFPLLVWCGLGGIPFLLKQLRCRNLRKQHLNPSSAGSDNEMP